MTYATAVPGVWCAGESVKLGRVCIGASGYVLRAGAGCTRLDTMIAGCDAWAAPIARSACVLDGRAVAGMRIREIGRDICQLCAEVWDGTVMGNAI
jgi:hypothetical protein